MELIVYPLLGEKSQRAISKKTKRFGAAYHYTPRRQLIARLSEQLKMSPTQVREQIVKERAFLKRYPEYYYTNN